MVDTTNILQRADADAEGLLGIVRMAIASTLGVVMFLAVNAPNRPDSPVLDLQVLIAAAIISGYFLIGFATYVLVRRGHYQMWMAWVTATLDMMLIAGNVWFSVYNTGVNALFALSFPSALMVPLVMTFGALRFRPSIQVAMTVLMAVLISAIVFLGPIQSQPDENALQYMSFAYGVPPNIARVVMIMATGGVIALAAWRARGLLAQVAAEAEQRTNLTRFLPRDVAKDMTDATLQRLRAGKAATLAIMFVDIRNFTQMAEHMSAEDASRLLSDYRSNILDIVEANSGIVDKFIGDGALVLFGATADDGRAASQAVDAATQLLDRIEKWNVRRRTRHKPAIRVGIGLHYGSVVVGAIGDERRLEFTVIGDEVNVASRVEQATKSTEFSLLATDPVIRHAYATPADGWKNLGEVDLRGRETGVRLWGYANQTPREVGSTR